MFKLKKFPSIKDKKAIVEAIKKAEESTSGEIRVYMEGTTENSPYERALYLFEELGVYKTTLRNGVLIYVAVNDRKFVILGDEGINKAVVDDFWESTKDIMQKYFQKGHFKTGIIEGVLKAGLELKTHFPYQEDDQDELSNEISENE